MAKFKYSMEEREAILAVKKAITTKMAILKDEGCKLTVGSPMMTVKIEFNNGVVETSAALIGKVLLGTADTTIELIDGFTKI